MQTRSPGLKPGSEVVKVPHPGARPAPACYQHDDSGLQKCKDHHGAGLCGTQTSRDNELRYTHCQVALYPEEMLAENRPLNISKLPGSPSATHGAGAGLPATDQCCLRPAQSCGPAGRWGGGGTRCREEGCLAAGEGGGMMPSRMAGRGSAALPLRGCP